MLLRTSSLCALTLGVLTLHTAEGFGSFYSPETYLAAGQAAPSAQIVDGLAQTNRTLIG